MVFYYLVSDIVFCYYRSMKPKLTKKDLPKIHALLYDEGLTKNEVAKRYDYSDTSAFKKGLASLGYCAVSALRPIQHQKETKNKNQ